MATLNYANALLKYGNDPDGALQVLDAVKEDSRSLFPMAIAYSLKGEWKRAESLLKEAAKYGNIHAATFFKNRK